MDFLHDNSISHAGRLQMLKLKAGREFDRSNLICWFKEGLEEEKSRDLEQWTIRGKNLELVVSIKIILESVRDLVINYSIYTTLGGSSLRLDVPTRWHSLIELLESIIRNWIPLKLTFVKLKIKCPLRNEDVDRMREFELAMLRTFVMSLCQDDSTCGAIGNAGQLKNQAEQTSSAL
ncbi:hypothetical protein Ciccas_010565 [Cichlidogyrus casuarinus]|uniref:Uncharacterized protein n=1 Tax=Cichlidogyrus casuarinus TaxID=1844966 RepID=A0ABD2PTR9_9PLAT